jgi:CRISPR-associated protein Cas2
MHNYLACFDISDNKNRDRAGKELLAYGQRVQKSVFEIAIRRPHDIDDIRRKLQPLLDDGDDLRFYRLCADCRSHSIGSQGQPLAHFPAAVVV